MIKKEICTNCCFSQKLKTLPFAPNDIWSARSSQSPYSYFRWNRWCVTQSVAQLLHYLPRDWGEAGQPAVCWVLHPAGRVTFAFLSPWAPLPATPFIRRWPEWPISDISHRNCMWNCILQIKRRNSETFVDTLSRRLNLVCIPEHRTSPLTYLQLEEMWTLFGCFKLIPLQVAIDIFYIEHGTQEMLKDRVLSYAC